MKTYLILTLILTIMMMTFPVIPLIYTNKNNAEAVQAVAQISSDITTENNTTARESIRVMRTSSGEVIELELYEYVCGALAAEMPLTYHTEALKAQAVACYTYALWIKNNADNASKELSDLSDDPSSHQGFLDEKQLKEKWADKYEENYEKIKQIVNSVAGQYISYSGEPIMAVYHSISNGKTLSAKAAWGNEVPYLQSVTAPGDRLSPDYLCNITLTHDEFDKKIKQEKSLNFDFNKKRIEKTEVLDTGYISSVTIYSEKLTSMELRSLLGLKSPSFTIKESKNSITFITNGYGHGVGMSQYSADYMARQGSNYKQILTHFYKNTTIVNQ